eukprot:s155_g44.t1
MHSENSIVAAQALRPNSREQLRRSASLLDVLFNARLQGPAPEVLNWEATCKRCERSMKDRKPDKQASQIPYPVFIPTRGRPAKAHLNWQATHVFGAPEDKPPGLKPVVCLVIEPAEEEEYRATWPSSLMLILPESNCGPGYARWVVQQVCTKFCLEGDPTNPQRFQRIWIVDDTLTMFYRLALMEKFVGCGRLRRPKRMKYRVANEGLMFMEALLAVQKHHFIGRAAVAGFLRDDGTAVCKRNDWKLDELALYKVVMLDLCELWRLGVEYMPQLQMYEDICLNHDVLTRGGHTLKCQCYGFRAVHAKKGGCLKQRDGRHKPGQTRLKDLVQKTAFRSMKKDRQKAVRELLEWVRDKEMLFQKRTTEEKPRSDAATSGERNVEGAESVKTPSGGDQSDGGDSLEVLQVSDSEAETEAEKADVAQTEDTQGTRPAKEADSEEAPKPLVDCLIQWPLLFRRRDFSGIRNACAADFLCGARSSFKTLEEKVAQALHLDDEANEAEKEWTPEDLVVPEGPLRVRRPAKPPPVDREGHLEHLRVPPVAEGEEAPVDETKPSAPRGPDRYNLVDGPVDPGEIQTAWKKEAEEEAANDVNLLAKERLESSEEASAVRTGDPHDDDEEQLLRDAEAAEAKGSRSFSYKTPARPPPSPRPRAPEPPVVPAPAPPAEPKKVTQPEAQQGVFVPGEPCFSSVLSSDAGGAKASEEEGEPGDSDPSDFSGEGFESMESEEEWEDDPVVEALHSLALLDEKSPTAAASGVEKSEPSEPSAKVENKKHEAVSKQSEKCKQQHFTPDEDSEEKPASNSKKSDAHEQTENAESGKAKKKPDAVSVEKCLSPAEQETLITGKSPKKPGRPKGTGAAKAKAKASAKCKASPKPKASAKAKAQASKAAAKAKAKAKSKARKAASPKPETEALEPTNTDHTLDYGEELPAKTKKRTRKTGNKAEPETKPEPPTPMSIPEEEAEKPEPKKPKRRVRRAASKMLDKKHVDATSTKGKGKGQDTKGNQNKPTKEPKKKREKTAEEKAKHSRKSVAYAQARKRALEQGCDEAQAKAAASKVICMH